MKYWIFPSPLDSVCTLTHDTGLWTITAKPDIHPSGRAGQSFTIPENTPDKNGAHLVISASNKVNIDLRGIHILGEESYLLPDDFHLQDEIECPDPIPTPEPEPFENPLDIIEYVVANEDYDLATKEGCGRFTERCVDLLHVNFSDMYGHIRKFGAQNNYNGHAVDALNLLVDHKNPDGSITRPGIYDLIISSESLSAKPAFNYKGEPAPNLWYYPA